MATRWAFKSVKALIFSLSDSLSFAFNPRTIVHQWISMSSYFTANCVNIQSSKNCSVQISYDIRETATVYTLLEKIDRDHCFQRDEDPTSLHYCSVALLHYLHGKGRHYARRHAKANRRRGQRRNDGVESVPKRNCWDVGRHAQVARHRVHHAGHNSRGEARGATGDNMSDVRIKADRDSHWMSARAHWKTRREATRDWKATTSTAEATRTVRGQHLVSI